MIVGDVKMALGKGFVWRVVIVSRWITQRMISYVSNEIEDLKPA